MIFQLSCGLPMLGRFFLSMRGLGSLLIWMFCPPVMGGKFTDALTCLSERRWLRMTADGGAKLCLVSFGAQFLVEFAVGANHAFS